MAGEIVLIVDDNLINLKLIKVLLTAEGYIVHTAGHANEALQVLSQTMPRLILMDLQLPDIDGLELTRRLKTDPRLKKIVILAITAYAMKGDKEKALAAGCDDYISKPIDTRALPSLLSEWISKQA